jgi:hypothetical protein
LFTIAAAKMDAMKSGSIHLNGIDRAVMRQISAADNHPIQEWRTMRKRHTLGDEQI